MPITFKNETHWRDSDIRRVVKAALLAGGVEDHEETTVRVLWSRKPGAHVVVNHGGEHPDVAIWLPKRGSKAAHSNPMIAVALEALCPDADATVMSYTESFYIANHIAYICAKNREMPDGVVLALYVAAAGALGAAQPSWAPPETFMIQKYKDPERDGTYLEFVEDKEKEIARAEREIAHAEAELAKVQGRLKKAQVKKRNAEKSLKSARERRVAN